MQGDEILEAAERQGLEPVCEALGGAGVECDLEDMGGGMVAIKVTSKRGDYVLVTESEETEGLYTVCAYDGDDDALFEDVFVFGIGGDFPVSQVAEKAAACIAWTEAQ